MSKNQTCSRPLKIGAQKGEQRKKSHTDRAVFDIGAGERRPY
jgi:hypothetical protein